jgi:hypothetical protein
MPIIVNQSPSDGQSVHFPLWHVVNSDLVGSTNLRCLFDIYIGGVFISRHKIYSPPDIGVNFYFDAAPIVRGYVERYFNPTNALFSWSTDDIYVEYEVQYGEQYTTTGGTVVTNANQSSSTHKVYNAYTPHHQAGSLVVVSGGHQILTDRDTSNVLIPRDGTFFIPYLKSTIGTNMSALVETYNGGTLIASPFQISAYAGLGKLIQLRVSQSIINAITGGTFPDTVTKYIVKINNGTTIVSTTVNISCNKNTPIQLHFLNRYGGFETFSFGLVNRLEAEYERNRYSPTGWAKTSISPINPPPDPSFYVGNINNLNTTTKVYNPTDSLYSIRHKYSYKLISDYVTETDYNWLRQLIASPAIYMEDNTYFYPVTVRETKWSQKKQGPDKMFNLEITIDSSNNIYSNA